MLEVTVKTLDGKNKNFCVPDDVGFAFQVWFGVQPVSTTENFGHERLCCRSGVC